ncbi:MAG: PQQ-binding-like beta-propeller repeat protein, partial [Limisphaerales bacterium]
FGSAGLFCYDLDGKKLWEQRMGPFHDEYGAGSSPLLCDDKIILNQDHDTDSFLAAFDRRTGRLLWKVPRPDAVRSYATPALWARAGKPELLVAGALQLSAYSPENGERLWWVNGLARIVIPTPISSGDTIYMASWAPGGDSSKRLELVPWASALEKWDANHDGKLSKSEIDDHEVLDRFFRMDLNQDGYLNQNEWERHAAVFHRAQNALLAIQPAGSGEQKPERVVWAHRRGIPYVATPVVDQGILWMVKEGGIVTKLDASTGELLQEERVPGFGNYFSSPVAGDGKVYFSSEPGTVSVLAATREWRVISSRNFHEKIYATPVLDHGHLFLRTERALYCFQGGRP